MAKSISEEELQLRKRARRRLIGAIALVTIVAVFLPMILDHEPKPVSQDISIRIPAPDSGIFTSRIAPIPPGTPDAKSRPAPAAQANSSEPSRTAAVTPAAKPTAVAVASNDTEAAPPKKSAPEQPKMQAKPVPTTPAKVTLVPAVAESQKTAQPAEIKGASGFVVQVAALNDADKAKQIQAQIAAAGVKSYTEVVPTTKGNVTRVRAGPFASRDEAEKIRDRLKDMGLAGNIVPK